MTSAIIIIAVILLIVLLLFLHVTLLVKSDDDLGVYYCVRYLFLKFDNKESNKKNKKEQSKNNDSVKKEKSQGSSGIVRFIKKLTGTSAVGNKDSFEKMAKKKGTISTVINSATALKNIVAKVLDLLKHFTVKRLMAKVFISSDDAAQTAINYGVACSAIYPVFGYIDSLIDIKEREVEVICDYDSKKCSAEFELVISFKVISFIIAVGKIINQNIKRQVGVKK